MPSMVSADPPIPVIELEKAILRPLNLGDIEEIFQIYSDREAMKFRANPPLDNREQAQKMIRASWELAFANKSIRWGIEEKSTRKIIGTFFWVFDGGKKVSEIGYSLNRDWWNKGMMTEIGAAMITWLFNHERVETLVAKSHKQNHSSMRVLEKLGFAKVKENEDQIVTFRKGQDLKPPSAFPTPRSS